MGVESEQDAESEGHGMNILCSVNDSYIRQYKCLVYSLAYSQSESMEIYFMNSSLVPAQMEELRRYTESLGIRFHEIVPPRELMNRLEEVRGDTLSLMDNFFSVEIYLRLFAPILLPENISRILWLDSDCIVQRDIRKMYNFNFKGRLGLVTIDGYERDESQRDYVRNSIKRPLGMEDEDILFNSGVFLMNLSAMRESGMFTEERILGFMKEHPEARFDQDILNCLLKGKVYINGDLTYNYPPNWTRYEQLVEDLPSKNILHYYGKHKPWLDDSDTPVIGVGPWRRAEKMSLIIDSLIEGGSI